MRRSELEGLHPPPFPIEFLLRPCVAVNSEFRRCFFATPRISNFLGSFYQRERKSLVGQRQVLNEVLAGSGHGFGGFSSEQRTTTRWLPGHQHMVVHSASGRNVFVHFTLTGKSNATHPQLLGCL